MLERFEGPEGKQRLIELLADQRLIQHNEPLACQLAEIVKVEELQATEQLYFRGKTDKHALYLVLSGSVDLSIEDRPTVTLASGQFLGEFPLLNASVDYAVAVTAREKTIIASVPENKFLALANDHPEIWRNMAQELAMRLRSSNAGKPPAGASASIKPAELTMLALWQGLTPSQGWVVITAVATALGAVAGGAYKMGSIKLFG